MSELDEYQSFIHKSRYARYRDDLGRRETWEETVDRYINFFYEKFPQFDKELEEARKYILDMKVMPSMRCLMTAGPALERDHVAGYNCAYVAVDHPRVFDEILYVLMCGTGVGFSVERQYVQKLPDVAETFHDSESTIIVSDSKVGWASGYRQLISLLYAGEIPKWNLGLIRGAGARLKTFGGRASGPAPLEDLFRFTVEVFKGSAGRKLNALECHDLVCKVASVVVVGGVRRSALISLSNLTDRRMRHAKEGNFYEQTPHRSLANNSVCYTETPDMEIFLEEWTSLYRSKSGERGIFNRVAADKQVSKNGRRETGHDWGCNPCSEIILRSAQFCNLTEVVVREEDTTDDLCNKVRVAAFLGTLQSSLTDFRYLRSIWRKNCEDERLLGVSLTGIQDHKLLSKVMISTRTALRVMREVAVDENKRAANLLGINSSVAITCVKPSGTVSQLVNSASGIHARYAPYYIRRVRADNKDPLAMWMQDKGFQCEPDKFSPGVSVFSFPVKAPDRAKTEGEVDAITQLELWKMYQDDWCEHKPSITVHYKPEDFLKIGSWVYENFDEVSGIAFLPKDDHVYQQAPYEAIDRATYQKIVAATPKVDWSEFVETYDNTSGSQELACSAGICDLPDLV